MVTASHANLTHANSCPFGAVPKVNPDRTVSDEVRVIHDLTNLNESMDKETHPPASQPYHRQLARLIMWWRLRYPGVEVGIAKIDIKAAFRRIRGPRKTPNSFVGTSHGLRRPWQPWRLPLVRILKWVAARPQSKAGAKEEK